MDQNRRKIVDQEIPLLAQMRMNSNKTKDGIISIHREEIKIRRGSKWCELDLIKYKNVDYIYSIYKFIYIYI